MGRVELVVAMLGLGFGWSVLTAMRRRKLSEREGLPWLGLSLLLLGSGFLRHPLDRLAAWLGVQYAPALWLLVGMVGLLLICLRLTMVITALQARVVRLTQELALLDRKEKSS